MKIKKIAHITWIHQITLPDGTITPGIWPPRYEEYGLTKIRFKDKRVLDIGCLDGLYSFYAEKQGAKEVVSIDINEEQFGKQTNKKIDWSLGYRTAHKLLKSKAKYIFPYSVYDLNKDEFKLFDIALLLGVLYHIAHPILALERINEILKIGGTLVVEAEIHESVTHFAHTPTYALPQNPIITSIDSRRASSASIINKIIRTLINIGKLSANRSEFKKRVNIKLDMLSGTLYRYFASHTHQGIYKEDSSNKWILSIEDVERIIDFSGFKITSKIKNPYSSRITCICKKMKPFPSRYADRSIYKKSKKRISNIDSFA